MSVPDCRRDWIHFEGGPGYSYYCIRSALQLNWYHFPEFSLWKELEAFFRSRLICRQFSKLYIHWSNVFARHVVCIFRADFMPRLFSNFWSHFFADCSLFAAADTASFSSLCLFKSPQNCEQRHAWPLYGQFTLLCPSLRWQFGHAGLQ